jgi:hypothetical protein
VGQKETRDKLSGIADSGEGEIRRTHRYVKGVKFTVRCANTVTETLRKTAPFERNDCRNALGHGEGKLKIAPKNFKVSETSERGEHAVVRVVVP